MREVRDLRLDHLEEDAREIKAVYAAGLASIAALPVVAGLAQ